MFGAFFEINLILAAGIVIGLAAYGLSRNLLIEAAGKLRRCKSDILEIRRLINVKRNKSCDSAAANVAYGAEGSDECPR